MSEKNDGGAAFPVVTNGEAYPRRDSDAYDLGFKSSDGMSLRDYFAAKVMQGLMSNPSMATALITATAASPDDALKVVANIAYVQADAMLAERHK